MHADGVVCRLLSIDSTALTSLSLYVESALGVGDESAQGVNQHQHETTMNSTQQRRRTAKNSQKHEHLVTGMHPGESPAADGTYNSDTSTDITIGRETALLLPTNSAEHANGSLQTPLKKVARGLSADIPTTVLQGLICERSLLLANRFRVIRTIDIAVACFAERPFKAALTAAQRAMRGMVKGQLLKRYRTDRFQTVYGLTQKGVDWLESRGREAASSVRRVSDMSNPEHRLWAQFLVLASEARGLVSLTEQELLQELNRGKTGKNMIQGLLKVNVDTGGSGSWMSLRPDAVCRERVFGETEVATTWYEVDRSKRGSNREAALAALAMKIGVILADGTRLKSLVVCARTERIQQRALAVIRNLAKAQGELVLIEGRRHFKEVEPGIFTVTAFVEAKGGMRGAMRDAVVGHIVVQMLPTWLPKARVVSDSPVELSGWFAENYLPHRRPASGPIWPGPKALAWTRNCQRSAHREVPSPWPVVQHV